MSRPSWISFDGAINEMEYMPKIILVNNKKYRALQFLAISEYLFQAKLPVGVASLVYTSP